MTENATLTLLARSNDPAVDSLESGGYPCGLASLVVSRSGPLPEIPGINAKFGSAAVWQTFQRIDRLAFQPGQLVANVAEFAARRMRESRHRFRREGFFL